MKKVNLFVDMDGTVAKFYHDKNFLHKMMTKGYFENLLPYAIAEQINALASTTKINVCILSACVDTPYCKVEKIKWLAKHMPNVKTAIFTMVGENKVQAVSEHYGNDINILLDDYSHNLIQWEQAGANWIGIKYLNGRNNKSKQWKGKTARTIKQLLQHI